MLQEGQQAYIVVNNSKVEQVTILKLRGDFCTVSHGDGALTLRRSRLFETKKEAERTLPEPIRRKLEMQPSYESGYVDPRVYGL